MSIIIPGSFMAPFNIFKSVAGHPGVSRQNFHERVLVEGGISATWRVADRARNIQLGLERIYDHMSTTEGGSSGGVQAA